MQTEDRTETLAIQYETTLKPALAGKKKKALFNMLTFKYKI